MTAGDKAAVRFEGRTQTHRELYERAKRLTNALRAHGITKGERVAVAADNCFETMEIVAGLTLGGYVRCPLYAHDGPDRHRYLIGLTEPAAIIVQDKYFAALAPVFAQCPSMRAVVVLGSEAASPALDYEAILRQATVDEPDAEIAPDDAHQIRFSAGTTGLPKGILHTLGAWMAAGDEVLADVSPPLTAEDCYLAASPLTHAASVPVWPILAAGGTIVVMPAFDAGRFLQLVEDEHVTVTLLVATMVQMITTHPEATAHDLSSLRAVFYGASPIPETTLVAALRLWGNVMYQSYGQSEAIPVAALLPEHHVVDGSPEQRRRLRSAGKATPNSGIRIVDEDDNILPPGKVGEIVVNSPGRMKEIWRAPEVTAQRLTEDGWVRTRDMGWLDHDGFLYLADRKEDMIISGGYNIWPAELENVLVEHPAVREAAVVGIPHEKWVETPHADVVLEDGCAATVSPQDLIDWTRERLGSVKKITSVAFVETLPKTPIGKVLRREIRDRYR
ncbi:class I adenylate-forming enzyme family protein [[Mycobacterium] burgundiense]|uniref:Class I adenylate-forming enzyme family protein n=1 Tax=[Mycobacterium] burgundiense TaxID=3064286 RepID=A0ABM9LUG8_9MYCO|nr:class I adenylate-forming enzyme family protein [Mycolicibacterium sp. MU0053]CAJ1504902.1 class I adenylate-forming enzyme family protein [Mycolicibacterium sp. MU0053]